MERQRARALALRARRARNFTRAPRAGTRATLTRPSTTSTSACTRKPPRRTARPPRRRRGSAHTPREFLRVSRPRRRCLSSVLSHFFARSSSLFVSKTVTCSRSSRTRSSAASSPRGSRAPTCALASIAPPRARPWLSLWSTRARENPPRPPPSKVLVNCNAPGAVATRLLDHVIARGGSLERRVGALGRALLVEWLVPVRSFAWHPRDGSRRCA